MENKLCFTLAIIAIIMAFACPLLYDHSFRIDARLNKLEKVNTFAQQPQPRQLPQSQLKFDSVPVYTKGWENNHEVAYWPQGSETLFVYKAYIKHIVWR
jgi:Tfp pilus assembly protein FimT